ncbi:PAS domain S-box protein [Peribacillus sp. TH24]|uniref:PAS domain S-box protein n=1 Tax=Peribacillus sp. TH24 TaxID=2798483 RepID=UPI0028BE153B|nr:PAS domain S-box protein [Peribacillus sp. TH24]
METILNTINDGIYISDSKGFTLRVNNKYAEMTGIAKNEVEGRHISELIFSGYKGQDRCNRIIIKKNG